MSENLLVTKLYIPSPALKHAPRPRLFQLLDDGLRLGQRLTLLCAPAGYGKTTLVSEWIHARKLRAAWLSLDEGDNDPVRFLSYLVAAIQAARPEVGEISTFQSSPGKPFEPALVSLVNELATLSDPLPIVLDDYHVIRSQPIHDSLSYLIENLPPRIHFFISTRADPPLSNARWRARGFLSELRMSELRFTPEETALFLTKSLGLSLEPVDISGLFNRTEGWAAGLQMAALALDAQASTRAEKDPSAFIRSFTGSDRYILDYFVEEILQQQPEAILAFLEQTSILERLCGSLCQAVTGAESWRLEADERFSQFPAPISSRHILEFLERANLFIVPLDNQREWYRYHRLFADLLHQRLLLAQPEIVPVLHQRASAWYEQCHYYDEAIRHAFVAGDAGRAARLIESTAESTLMRSEIATFMGWIEQLPETELHERPDLMVFHAMTMVWSGAPLEEIETTLAFLEQVKIPSAKAAPLRAFIAINKGQISLAKQYCQGALESIPESNLLLRGLADLMNALCYILDGDLHTGVQSLEKAAIFNRKTGNLMVAVLVLYQLAELRQKEGQLRLAQALYQQVLELTGDSQGGYLPIAGRALVGLGEIAWAQNELETAKKYVLEGNRLAEQWSQVSAFDGYVALVTILQSQGDLQGAEQALVILHKLARQFDITNIDDLVVDLLEARLRLAQGDLAAVHRWAKQRGLEGAPGAKRDSLAEDIIIQRLHKYEALTLARLWLAEGCPDEALAVLEQQLTELADVNRPVLLIETELLCALALQEQGESQGALRALERALCLAEPEGFARIFIDGGDKVGALLKSARSTLQSSHLQAFMDQLLLALTSPVVEERATRLRQPDARFEPLSAREIEVLRLLSSGLSSREMADELYISVHTLRSHLKSIYGKLGVHSRYEANARARELDLL